MSPPGALSEFVHSFWELKSDSRLPDDLCLHALPDACVNILFNQADTRIAGVTALRTTYEVLNLGKEFHYVGIQFLPGVWQGDQDETTDSFVGTPYIGDLPLIETSNELVKMDFPAKQLALSKLVHQLIEQKLVAINIVTAKILSHIDTMQTVADMAADTHMSSRQLQRVLKRSTGFSPHDLLKVLRLQQSFKQTLEDMKDPTNSNVLMKSFPTDMAVYGAGGALVQREGSSPGIGGTVIYFGVEDCSIEEARVNDAGGQLIRPKMSIGEFGWISLCMDTEGNMFGLSSMK